MNYSDRIKLTTFPKFQFFDKQNIGSVSNEGDGQTDFCTDKIDEVFE